MSRRDRIQRTMDAPPDGPRSAATGFRSEAALEPKHSKNEKKPQNKAQLGGRLQRFVRPHPCSLHLLLHSAYHLGAIRLNALCSVASLSLKLQLL